MLFAELHGKLDPNSPDLERREDVLTSSTFGTLLVADAAEILVDWLNCARRLGPAGRLDHESLDVQVHRPVQHWFWPSLAGGTQPDLILRIGSLLLVIEAKYGSAKGGSDDDGEADANPDGVHTSDQLLREWQAVGRQEGGLAWYPSDLRAAIEQCERRLIYLVSARRAGSALVELRESQEKIRVVAKQDVTLWLLTWQDLHAVLVRRTRGPEPVPGWVPGLARLLEHPRNLASFLGFAEAAQPIAGSIDTLGRWANEWRNERVADVFSFGNLDLLQFHRTVSVVEAWAANQQFTGVGDTK